MQNIESPIVSQNDLLERLIKSDNYQELLCHRPPFDLFSTIGKHHLLENGSSRALAYLMDSHEDHGLGTYFLKFLLQQFPSGAGKDNVKSVVEGLLNVNGVETSCETEWTTGKRRRVDILVRVHDQNGIDLAVLGIENKHGFDERDEQISDYQRAIVESFPSNIPRLVIFLTPGARRSWTAKPIDGCPHIECSYLMVTAALRSCYDRLHGPIAVLVTSLANHLESRLEAGVEMNSEVQFRVHELYRDSEHRKAIRLILKYLPTFGALLPRIKERVFTEDLAEVKLSLRTYPKQQVDRLKEVYFYPKDLRPLTKPHGFTLGYVLHPDYKKNGWRAPDLGDRMFLQLAAWCSERKARDTVERLRLAMKLPPSKAGLQQFDKWYPIWSAGTYTLRDFGDLDVQGCSQLLIDAIGSTYRTVKTAIEQRYGVHATDGQ